MADPVSTVEVEIEDHKTELTGWIDTISARQVLPSKKGVTDRFVRDCRIMMQDLNTTEEPSTADLCDFVDRKNSLEIQYHNISQDQ